MPNISAMPSTGTPTWVSTMVNVIRPAEGTAAVPMEARVDSRMITRKSAKTRSTPYTLAMKTVAMPCMMAVPSMLMVAPSGTVKDAMEFGTLNRLVNALSVTGIVAAEEAVLKANVIGARMRARNLSAFSPKARNTRE